MREPHILALVFSARTCNPHGFANVGKGGEVLDKGTSQNTAASIIPSAMTRTRQQDNSM